MLPKLYGAPSKPDGAPSKPDGGSNKPDGDRPQEGLMPDTVSSDAKPSEQTPVQKMLAEARAAMYGTKDLKAGIQASTPQFTQAVDMSTADLLNAARERRRAHDHLDADAQAEDAARDKAQNAMNAAMGSIVDPVDRGNAFADMTAWLNKKESDPAYAGLTQDLQKYGMLEAAKDVKSTMEAPATVALANVDRNMAMAIEQAIHVREGYASALNEAGRAVSDPSLLDKSWQLEREAVALTKRSLPEKRPEPELPDGQHAI
jgi:hypothetical protein